MGSKRTDSSSMEESVAELGKEKELNAVNDNGSAQPSKKRTKKKIDTENKEVPDAEVGNNKQTPTVNENGSSEPSRKRMNKKRDAENREESVPASIENGGIEPSKRKIKKKVDSENWREANAVSTSLKSHNPSSVNSMERRKKRKLLDKERNRSETKKIETDSEARNESYDSATTSNSGGGILPELHLGVFKNLAAFEASSREAAARALVTELREIQNAFEKLVNKDDVEDDAKLEAQKDDGLNNCAPSVRYAVRRLIRGVSSSRECARQGFALGLSILVGTVPSIKLESLLKLIINLLEVSSSMKGQEARDCLLGRLFAYGAVARSGKLTQEWALNNNTPFIKEFTSSVIALGAKKRYLQESAVAIILEMIGKLPAEALWNHVLEAPGLQEWLERATEVGNPDALLLALKLQEKVSVDNKFAKLLTSPYSKSTFFSADHLSYIGSCLKESTFCQPRVHSLWPILVNNLLPDIAQDADSAPGLSSTKKHKKSRKGVSAEEDIERHLQCFCQVIIEGSLLPSSHDRKKLAFDVLLLLLPKLPASCVQIVLSYKVVQCLMDILSTKDSWLFKVAQHFLTVVSDWVMHDDVRRVEVIVALQKHSNGKFDGITRTKTVRDLTTEFKTESGCLAFIQNLVAMFLDEGQSLDEPSDQSQTTDDNSEIGSVEDKGAFGLGTSEFLKSWVVECLPSVSKHLKLDQNARFRVQKEVLKFLAVQGLFSSSLGTEVTSFELQEKFRWPKSTSPSALCQMCIEQLQLLLANVQKGEGPHTVSSGVEANDLGSYFMRFISILCNIPSVSLSRTLSVDDEKAFKNLQAMETRLSREERNSGLSMVARKLHALRYLLIQLLLQILLRPGDFFEAASELVICCKKAFVSSDLLEYSGEDESDEDSAPQLMDVLVDTMLSLLPNSSASMRSAIEQVFKYFCEDITDDGLLRMLRIIKKDLKPARHQTMDSEEDNSDDDILGVEEANETDESETGETADNDEQTDDSEAVGGVEAVTTELPEGTDDDSDGGLDDDAMFRIDQKFATMVRERNNKAGVETAHSQLVLFKLRVLSLLEIFLHENPGKAQVLKVFSSLAQAFTNPQTSEGSEQLGQRIWGIIQKKIFKAKDYPGGEEVEFGVLESLLEKYLKLAAKPFKRKKAASSDPLKKKQSTSWNRYKMITSLAQNSTFWILKIIDGKNFSETELQRVCDIFKNIVVSYFDSKKSQLKPEFLKETFRRRPWIGHHLFGFLLEKCSRAKSQFRQVEALDLVTEILKPFLSSNAKESGLEVSKMLESHLPKLCILIKHLVTNMPEKQSRRADVRKFCGKVFQILKNFKLSFSFLEALEPECHGACESQLGEIFLALKKSGN